MRRGPWWLSWGEWQMGLTVLWRHRRELWRRRKERR